MIDPRAPGAFRTFLSALATDPDAAIAASLAYSALDGNGRDAWLDAVKSDLCDVDVPKIAAYAPIVSVEQDPTRRSRILGELGPATDALPSREIASAFAGTSDGTRVMVLVVPLYLSFVELITCRFHAVEGVRWVKHEPLARSADAPSGGAVVDGAVVEMVPPVAAIDELAHAILATRRSGRALPDELAPLADLLSS